MTMNDFLLWLIPPIVFVAGGALAAYLSHRQHH
jgi:cytochrome c-type biogenesis protein CcmH/NrfF